MGFTCETPSTSYVITPLLMSVNVKLTVPTGNTESALPA